MTSPLRITQEQTEILECLMATYGEELQLRKLQEECLECALAVARVFDGREGSGANLIEESVDVLLTALQVRSLSQTSFDEIVEFKLKRAKDRMEVPNG